MHKDIYKVVVCRFLAIFYPPAEYNKIQVTVEIKNEDEKNTNETFNTSGKVCINQGFLEILKQNDKKAEKASTQSGETVENLVDKGKEEKTSNLDILKLLKKVKK